MKTVVAKAKKETLKFSTDHRVLHSTVSKVGKTIDKVCRSFINTEKSLYYHN